MREFGQKSVESKILFHESIDQDISDIDWLITEFSIVVKTLKPFTFN